MFLASRRNPLNLVCGESARHSNESSLSRVRGSPCVTNRVGQGGWLIMGRTEQEHKAIICISPKSGRQRAQIAATQTRSGARNWVVFGRQSCDEGHNELSNHLDVPFVPLFRRCGPLSFTRPLSSAHSFVHSFIQLWPLVRTKAFWLLGHTVHNERQIFLFHSKNYFLVSCSDLIFC